MYVYCHNWIKRLPNKTNRKFTRYFAAALTSQSWPALRTTFGSFLPRPRTAAEAEAAGWQLLSSCSEAGPFLGARYGLAEDNSIILIYDAAGYIAGTQVSCDWRRAVT